MAELGTVLKTQRELREEELMRLYPDLRCDPAAFSDTELNGLIQSAVRREEQQPNRRRRVRR